jgi:hypothetical protein
MRADLIFRRGTGGIGSNNFFASVKAFNDTLHARQRRDESFFYTGREWSPMGGMSGPRADRGEYNTRI